MWITNHGGDYEEGQVMKKCYIAAPIFNDEQLEVVRAITIQLKMLEYEYFSPYEASRAIWKGRAPKDCSPEERAEVLKGNIDNLHWAQLLVCWVGGTPNGKTDTGVVWEMGYFNAMSDYRKAQRSQVPPPIQPILAFTLAYIHPTDVRKDMNLMLAGTVDAVAHGPAQLSKALEYLRRATDERHFVAARRMWHPDQAFIHEAEPVG